MLLPNGSWKNKIQEMQWQLRLWILLHTFKPLSTGKTPQNMFFNFVAVFSNVFSPWAPPFLSWSSPWVAEWRLVLAQLLTCYIPVAGFSCGSAEHTCVSKCAAEVHDWKQNDGVGTQHTLWRLLFNRVISYAQADVPVICKQCPPRSSRDVLAVEVKDKIPPSTGDATLRLGIQVYLIRMSFAFPNWLNHFSRSSFPIHTTVNERRAMYSATWLKASHCRPTKIDD